MKRNFLTYAMLAALVSVSPAIAKDANKQTVSTPKSNLQEIILDTNRDYSYDLPNNLLMASETQPAVNLNKSTDTSEITLENKVESKKDKGLLSIFNLQGGIEKADKAIEAGIEKTAVQNWIDGSYATGKWFGARPLFEDHGVTVNSSLLYSPFVKTGGGAYGEGSGKGYSLFNLSVTVDTEKAGGWKGGTFYALYQKKTGYGLSGSNGNGAMGDIMGFDGWDWRQMNQISEAWYQQKLFNNKLRLKVGKQDANTDFCFLNSGWNFMNTAFSINPTVLIPTYPDQSFGFVAEINPKEWLSIKNGTYSRYNVPFNISEIEVRPKIKKLPGRYMLGAWELSDSNGMSVNGGIYPDGTVYTNDFHRNFGTYIGFEQMVYKEQKDNDNDLQGLVVFGQAGMSPSNRNDMSKYVGGGLQYTGPFKNRDKDILGVAVGSGNFASRLADITSQIGSETAIETFYRIQLTPWFYLQPDVQYIMNPGGQYASSVAIGLRSVVTF